MARLQIQIQWSLICIIVVAVVLWLVFKKHRCSEESSNSETASSSETRHSVGAGNRASEFYAHAFKDSSGNIIYIRHGHDASSGYHHDQRLTSQGWSEAKKLARKLVKEHGSPSVIYYSPFDRTTDTAKAMYRVLRDELNIKDIKLKIEPKLGKYFSSTQRNKPSVSHATVQRGMIINSSKQAYTQGLDEHHLKVKKRHPGEVVWNVTHAIGVNHHLKRVYGKSYNVEYLEHIAE